MPAFSNSNIAEALRGELLSMRDEDRRVRAELAAAGELGGPYVPRMEAVHLSNAARLRDLIAIHGWPTEDIASADGAEAAWLIAQHAVGELEFQRDALTMIQASGWRVPAWHAAYLADRIALHEGRPQRFGTQWVDDPTDGRVRPWKLEDPSRVNEWRSEAGLPPLAAISEPGPPLSEAQRHEIEESQRWWENFFVASGWRSG